MHEFAHPEARDLWFMVCRRMVGNSEGMVEVVPGPGNGLHELAWRGQTLWKLSHFAMTKNLFVHGF